ncbi:2Fe-2S iron-sulfur cluster-binding protein [Halobacteriovorax sp. GB3]|uniref:2Fe-2S iron-sulfur cluster-binding protein n=1 Tax=Halobacteriovorax sp. GB3 TaxID=2719615 RepID=UPI002362A7BF|nr:2Fe-2S iron-sulfur cluster-binding protein [Halobacteriovorax sp. GB3]MDD0854417.1 2Fe-2S iron-sulfur cluster-binding protein [Halobacteriovorax sp. GB3]
MPNVSIVELDDDANICNDEEKCFKINENQVIYDELEMQGEKLPHGCLAGSCGTCRILVLEGAENLKEPSYIEKDTIEHIKESYKAERGEEFLEKGEIRLSCRARILGNVKFGCLKK